MTPEKFCHKIEYYIQKNIPFFFLIDFEKKTPLAVPISDCKKEGIHFQFNKHRELTSSDDILLNPSPIAFNVYKKSFDTVKKGIAHGNSFLVNLTFPTPLSCEADLKEIYSSSKALYKLLFKDQFVVFSPERFIQIRNNEISTFPMKGTILADLPNAEGTLFNNKKEAWEHNTIVDLMRNDLSMLADDVEVKRFRYISEIMTDKGKLLQTSSEISGKLRGDWQNNFGELLLKLLPAGSICGAPKDKTLSIINEAEIDSRGYYTGIFGTYDNGKVDSAIAIRYIEKTKEGKLHYRSGGGITFMSDAEEEYRELINKIYVPTR
ncbi:MAG: aminodeoxychorismate synthase component I [Bacteroidales bacterium]|nr:aminodeoxychorismate synthase component I [Bacteroidales bacterium]